MEARIAKPGKAQTISYYWVANFKLDEINWKIEKNTLNITIYEIAEKILLLNMRK